MIKKYRAHKKHVVYRKKTCDHRGQALILATIFVGIVLALSVAIVNRSLNLSKESRDVNKRIAARTLAEAGIEKAIFCLNQTVGDRCGGNFGETYVGENNIALGGGTFTTSITTIDTLTKSITSTGYIPNAANPQEQVTLKTSVTINTDVINFNYGIQAGLGGIQMQNSATIIGNVYTNGSIIGGNSAEITGDAIVAGGTALVNDQEDTAQRSAFLFGKTSPQLDIAQSFKISTDSSLNKISLYIKKTGAPPDATLRILADMNGVPSKIVLGSGTLNASQVTSNYSWVDVTLSLPPSLLANTTYWFSIDTSAKSSKYWTLGLDDQNGYGNGKAMFSANWNASSPTWTDAGGDFNFKIWSGGFTTKIQDVAVGNDAKANTLSNVHLDRDAYAQLIDDSWIGRDGRAAIINDSTIIRDAYANSTPGTTVGGHTYSGNGEPDPAPQNMPISSGQMQEWKDAAAAGGTSDSISLSQSDTLSLGPRKINGNVSLSSSASIKITGPVWITGNLTLQNQSTVYIDPVFGANGTMLVVSGKINIGNQAQLSGTGVSGSYLLVISEYPGTANGDEAIIMANGTATAILFAPNGAISLSNSVGLKEATALLLKIGQSATVTYESGLANASFSTGPDGSWVLKKGTWQEV